MAEKHSQDKAGHKVKDSRLNVKQHGTIRINGPSVKLQRGRPVQEQLLIFAQDNRQWQWPLGICFFSFRENVSSFNRKEESLFCLPPSNDAHPLNNEFCYLPSGSRLKFPMIRGNQYKFSFIPAAISVMNWDQNRNASMFTMMGLLIDNVLDGSVWSFFCTGLYLGVSVCFLCVFMCFSLLHNQLPHGGH